MEEKNPLIGETYLDLLLEKQLRIDVYTQLLLLSNTEAYVLSDPHLKSMFDLQGGFRAYASDLVLSSKDSDPLLTVIAFYCIELLFRADKGGGGISPQIRQILQTILNEQQELSGFIRETLKPEIDDTIKKVTQIYNEEINPNLQDLKTATSSIIDKLNDPGVTEEILRELSKFVPQTNQNFRSLNDKVDRSFQKTNKLIEDKFKTLDDKLDQIKEELVEEIPEETVARVLGVPYYRWQTTTTCYPTVIFNFVEETVANRRTSQIMAKLNTPSKDITQTEIDNLKGAIQGTGGFGYQHGFTRGNYSSDSPGSSWKTTVFASSNQEVISILQKVCYLVGEDFDEECLSFTTGRRRLSKQQQKRQLSFNLEEQINANFVYPVTLYRVGLILTNSDKPIVLWRKN